MKKKSFQNEIWYRCSLGLNQQMVSVSSWWVSAEKVKGHRENQYFFDILCQVKPTM